MPKRPATHPPTTAESRRALGKLWWMGATGERCFFSWQHEEEEETFGFWHEPHVAKTTTTKKKRYKVLESAFHIEKTKVQGRLLITSKHWYFTFTSDCSYLHWTTWKQSPSVYDQDAPNFVSHLPHTGPCKQGSAKGQLTQEKHYIVAGDCALPLDIWVHRAAHTPTAAAYCSLSFSLWALVPKIWSVAQAWLTACRWMKDRYQVCLNPRMWHSQKANLKRPFILEYHMCLVFWLFFFNLDLLYG